MTGVEMPSVLSGDTPPPFMIVEAGFTFAVVNQSHGSLDGRHAQSESKPLPKATANRRVYPRRRPTLLSQCRAASLSRHDIDLDQARCRRISLPFCCLFVARRRHQGKRLLRRRMALRLPTLAGCPRRHAIVATVPRRAAFPSRRRRISSAPGS